MKINLQTTTLIPLIIFTNFCLAQDGSLESILEKACLNSYELKLATINVKISEKSINESRAELFPSLSLYANTDYMKDIREEQTLDSSIDSTILWDSNKYQSNVYLKLSYVVFDFFAGFKKVHIMELDKQDKESVYDQELRNLRQNVAGIYAKTLALQNELQIKREILKIQNEQADIVKRLNKAGKQELAEAINASIQVAELTEELALLEGNLEKTLAELTFYTREKSDPNNFDLIAFKEYIRRITINPSANREDQAITFNIENAPEQRSMKLQLAMKKEELEITEKANWPTIEFGTKYYAFGSDPDSFTKSYSDIVKKDVIYSVYTSLPLFDGFRNTAQQEKLKLEVAKINCAKEKNAADLQKQYTQIAEDKKSVQQQLENSEKSLELIDQNVAIISRLKTNGFKNKDAQLKQEVTLLNKKLEIIQFQINYYLAVYKAYLMRSVTGGNK